MAANTLFSDPFALILDASGNPLVGAKITTFQAGTSTPQAVYTEPTVTTAWTQPIVTNAAGQSTGPIYVRPTPALKIVVVDANGVAVPGYPMDFWSPSAVAS